MKKLFILILFLVSFNAYCQTGASYVFGDQVEFGTLAPTDSGTEGDIYYVTSDGTASGSIVSMWNYDSDSDTWVQVPLGGSTCLSEMTRAALLALRNSSSLDPQCHYIITNPDANGNLDAQKILLHAIDASTLSGCYIFTTHDNTAWTGSYDIDANDVVEVFDHLNKNELKGNDAIIAFPFGNASVQDNVVEHSVLTVNGGTVQGNNISNRSNVIVNSGNFLNNVIETDANITSSANTQRNHFEAQSNSTINSGDFLENRVESDATVISSTTLDVDNNVFRANSSTTINTGNFDANEVHSDANVLINGGVAINGNHFYSLSNTTINAGDFRENQVQGDATVTSSTTGDVDNNTFGNLSNVTVNAGNLDYSTIESDATLINNGGNITASEFKNLSNTTVNGGTFADNTVGEDATVTVQSGSNYENVFGASTVYNQVGTGYIRYSTIEGTTTVTNGNTNISNCHAYVSTINTTGSTGTLSNTIFTRAYAVNMRNIPSLTITDCDISGYAQISGNGATRLYLYRSTAKDGSRILLGAGSRIDASYTNLDSYSYLQCNQNGGFLRANYCKLSGLGYIRNLTTNANYVDRCVVEGQANIRFDGSANNCRIYYSTATSGGAIYHNGTSNGSYIYYASASSVGQIYTTNSVNARMYYNNADSYSYIRSLNCPGTHYMYYCNASSRGYVQMNTAGGRMYAVSAAAQSIAEKRGTGGNIYYSDFSSYFYAYMTRTTGTSSGLFGQGRRTQTITNPVNITPYNIGAAWLNF